MLHYVSVLKSFFVYISDNNDDAYTYENEFNISHIAVRQAKKIKYLTDEEVYKIVDYLDNRRLNRGSYYDHIYALGVKIMLYGGLRISELLSLRLHDFTLSDFYSMTKVNMTSTNYT